jgi:hypothetical protein
MNKLDATDIQSAVSAVADCKRKFGVYIDHLSVPDTFFDPLPECELKAWEGESFDGDPLHDANQAHGNRADL